MSSDITSDVPRHIRCEAIASSSIAKPVPCHRPHGTILRHPGSGRVDLLHDDPAILIGLAIANVRQGKGLTGTVPDAVTSRLQAHADHGNLACRLLLDWLDRRNSAFVSAPRQVTGHAAPSSEQRTALPVVWRRRPARTGRSKVHKATAVRSTELKTAIIAATAEGRVDE
ncbi:hypothetical protein BTR14_13235 [Rhizobium rhizosphaerae]|uniref:Uncharacterized protein n=1 Tax=Xaviernesmea rhizosphaerae TaxID=1672749 RepID=A0ABX3PC40_9HYPH|nr:hypothetical protein [Xaviernesmea rhizosphaerae]OQP86041.1 hypothetical protein BTR14_13235 [Xaviernesmea rhizosphaerae]